MRSVVAILLYAEYLRERCAHEPKSSEKGYLCMFAVPTHCRPLRLNII